MSDFEVVQFQKAQADGVDVFYRAAGDPSFPVILLLHGFPASSFQFRNLIPLLAKKYRVIAPDLPGFGFTVVPDGRKYEYTFDNLAKTIQAFLDVLKISRFAVYVFDYGVSNKQSSLFDSIHQRITVGTDGFPSCCFKAFPDNSHYKPKWKCV